jgi:hypothetical protein
VIVARTSELAEAHLSDGTLYCPACGGRLTRWGFGRARTIRSHGHTTVELRPRRVRCTDCLDTHIVMPAAFQARRADTTEVIGQALLHKANGIGYRRIATLIDRAESTVRRWLGRARPAHLNWIYQQGVQRLVQLAPDELATQKFTGNPVHDSLTVLGAAAFWDRRRFGFTESAWTLIGSYTRGRLLAPPR